MAVDAASPTAGTPGRVGIGSYRGYPRVSILGWLEWKTPEKHSFEEAPKDQDPEEESIESPERIKTEYDDDKTMSWKGRYGGTIPWSDFFVMPKAEEYEQVPMPDDDDPIMKELPLKKKQGRDGRWYTPKHKDHTKR